MVFLIVFLIIFWALIQKLKDLKDSNLNENSAEYLQYKQKQQYNLSPIVFKMKIFTKLILISLLCVAIYTQSNQNHGDSTYYVENGQAYLHIYGQGEQGVNSHGDRDVNSVTLGDQLKYQTTTQSGPIPVTIDCPHNQVYDNKLCICVCRIGHYFDGEECVPNIRINAQCKRNQIYQDGRCVCNKGFFLIQGVCDVCPPYSTYDLPRLRCICAFGYSTVNGKCVLNYNPPIVPLPPSPPKCGLNQRLINNICVCIQDFFPIKGQCTYCPLPNIYDPQLAICKPKCGLNQVLDINTLKCICAGGFTDINGNCGKCRSYSVYNHRTKDCDCVQGYVLNNYNCIPETHAPVLPPPLTPTPVICGNNQNFVNGQCVCETGYHLINGSCIRCSTGTFYDATLKICRIPCNANQVYNILTKVCDCAKDSFRIGGVCSKCPGETKYDAQSQLCICQPGYSNVNGVCVFGCGVNQVLSNGICCCKTGYYPIGGVCGKCGWDEVYDQGLGICRVPCDQKRIYNIALRKCVCLPHFHELANDICTTCPTHSTYDPITKSCVCNTGYIKNLGLCISACNNYEQFVNGKCVCRTGYYLIGYSCGVCPPLTVYDSTYRICRSGCKNNEVWDITIRACRCLPGFYLVQGVCSQCNPLTQVYDQKNQCCECKSGYFKTPGQGCNGVCIPRCTDNEDWLGNRCVCKPGFYLINNFCTKCPDGQFYDIYQRICRIQCGINQVYNFHSGKCDCAKGFVIIQGACSKCPENYIYDEYKQECKTNVCPGVNQFYSPITGLCVCQSRYVRIKGVCSNCAPGFYYDSYSDSCLCKPGFKHVNGFCQPICPSDQTFINGKCYCIEGQLKNGICIINRRCPLYSSWDKSSQCCVCNPGYSIINGVCTQYQYCGENGYLRYGKCYCKNGFFWILNRCSPCGLNQAYNGVVCQCLIGYTRDIYGTCIVSNFEPNCYNNERYDPSLKACVCIAGTQYINSRCVKVPTCGENSYYNGIACTCNTGYTLVNGACTVVAVVIPDCPDNSYFNGVSCTCNTGYSLNQNNGCSQCSAGLIWDGSKCTIKNPTSQCANGFVLNRASNVCEPEAASCGEHSIWNGALCVCTANAHQIDGRCQVCVQGTTFDGVKCVENIKIPSTVSCGSNQIEVQGKCVCAAGFNDFGGQCIKCPENTQWNGKYCHCKVSDPTKWCVGRSYTIFIQGSCSCQAGKIQVMGLCSASG